MIPKSNREIEFTVTYYMVTKDHIAMYTILF